MALDLGVEAVEVDVPDHLLGGRALKPALGPEAAKHLLRVGLRPGAPHLGLRHVSGHVLHKLGHNAETRSIIRGQGSGQ